MAWSKEHGARSQEQGTRNQAGTRVFLSPGSCILAPVTSSPARRRYRCADGAHIAIVCESEAQWQALAKCLGRPELAYGGAWQAARGAPPRGHLGRLLEEIFAEDAAEVWVKRLEAHGVPAWIDLVRGLSP